MVTEDDNEARLHDVPTGKEVAGWQESSLRASFDGSGQRLLLQSKSGLVRLMDSASGMEISRAELGCEDDDWGWAEFRSEDDSLVLLCHHKGRVRTLNSGTGEETVRFTVEGWFKFFSPCARFIISQDKDLQFLSIHETRTGQEFGKVATNGFRVQGFPPPGRVSMPGQPAVSSDSRYLAIPSATGSVRVADLSSCYHRLEFEAAREGRIHLSRDHRLLAFADPDHAVQVIDMATGRNVGTLRHDEPTFPVHISSDGFLITIQKPFLKLNEIQTGREVARLQQHSGYSMETQTSPDGHYLAIGNYRGSSGGLVSSSSLEEFMEYPFQERCGDPAFSPDDRRFAITNRFQHIVRCSIRRTALSR